MSLFLSQGNSSSCSLTPIISHKFKDFALAFIPSLSCIIIISSTLDKSHPHKKQLQNIPHLKTLPSPMSLSISFPHFYSLNVTSSIPPIPGKRPSPSFHEAHFINFTIACMLPNTAIPFLFSSHSPYQLNLTELVIHAEIFPSIDSHDTILY